MNEESAISADAGCLGALVAVALVSLILTLGMIQSFGSFALYIFVFPATAIVFGAIGFPLYLVARRFGWENLWVAMLCGAATGAVVPLTTALAEGSQRAWLQTAAYAATGMVGGIAFFLAATLSRNRPRNIALLIALTGFSAALAPVAAPLFA
jgi:hypothetical protein